MAGLPGLPQVVAIGLLDGINVCFSERSHCPVVFTCFYGDEGSLSARTIGSGYFIKDGSGWAVKYCNSDGSDISPFF